MYWNTFLYDCAPEQRFVEGRKVLLSLRRVPGEDLTEFQPQITLVQPHFSLQWVATLPGFSCESSFELQDLGGDRTQYIHQEQFSGRLSRLFLPFIRQDEYTGICRMARELKRYVEQF